MAECAKHNGILLRTLRMLLLALQLLLRVLQMLLPALRLLPKPSDEHPYVSIPIDPQIKGSVDEVQPSNLISK